MAVNCRLIADEGETRDAKDVVKAKNVGNTMDRTGKCRETFK